MTNVGALISTQGGLRTVVQVLPGHVDPTIANVVTEPLGGNADASLPPEFFGTPLPGQAQSSATFVQTMVFPSDSASSDSADTTDQSATAPAATDQASPSTSTSGTTWPDAAASSSSDQGSASTASTNGQASNNTSQASQAFTQAATAYQAAQQRSGGNTQHSVIVG